MSSMMTTSDVITPAIGRASPSSFCSACDGGRRFGWRPRLVCAGTGLDGGVARSGVEAGLGVSGSGVGARVAGGWGRSHNTCTYTVAAYAAKKLSETAPGRLDLRSPRRTQRRSANGVSRCGSTCISNSIAALLPISSMSAAASAGANVPAARGDDASVALLTTLLATVHVDGSTAARAVFAPSLGAGVSMLSMLERDRERSESVEPEGSLSIAAPSSSSRRLRKTRAMTGMTFMVIASAVSAVYGNSRNRSTAHDARCSTRQSWRKRASSTQTQPDTITAAEAFHWRARHSRTQA
eukprot:4260768-Prymnesium_polylepis.2